MASIQLSSEMRAAIEVLVSTLGAGAAITFSEAAPGNGDGNDGDAHFDLASGNAYKKAAGVWVLQGTLGGGENGLSAYEVAVANGFTGTEAAWLASLVGPQGEQGEPGMPGSPGGDGAPGADGAAATIAVGTVTTLAPGSSATVVNSGTSSAAVLDFGIPEGEPGAPGSGGAGAVDSVNGQTGAVVLDAADVGAAAIVHNHDDRYYTETETDGLLSAKQNAASALALGETSATAYRGDRGKTAYDHSQLTTGNPHNVTKSDVGLGNVDNTADSAKTFTAAQISDSTSVGRNVLAAANAAAARTAIGAGTGDGDVTLTGVQTLTNKTLTAPVINNPSGFLTGAAKITVGTTAPASPATGDIWIDTN